MTRLKVTDIRNQKFLCGHGALRTLIIIPSDAKAYSMMKLVPNFGVTTRWRKPATGSDKQ